MHHSHCCATGVTFKEQHQFSDGAKSQFKGADHFLWISMCKLINGLKMIWNFFCSCHGKCWCDPEGGSIKHKLATVENTGKEMPTAKDVFDYTQSAQ